MSNSVLEAKPHTDTIQTGINERGQVADRLIEVLSDSQILMVKTQAVHWNITGPLFHSVHTMTEEQYNDLFAAIDIIAERVRALGHLAPTSMASMLKTGNLQETEDQGDAQAMLRGLIADNEALVRQVRDVAREAADHKDGATEDLMNARLAAHEKAIWMLRATLG